MLYDSKHIRIKKEIPIKNGKENLRLCQIDIQPPKSFISSAAVDQDYKNSAKKIKFVFIFKIHPEYTEEC